MLPNLSSLTLAPDGPCRPCGPRRPRRPVAMGVRVGEEGWELQDCPICTYPLGEDSQANPWNYGSPYAGACCAQGHAYHKGCILELKKVNPNAPCPECREPILPGFADAPGTFTSRDALNAAVDEILDADPTGATEHPIHGPISEWKVGRVTNMDQLFRNADQFNQPLDGWDVSKVESMEYMFQNATSFNQPLDGWDVSKVESMEYMFQNATSFNQPLNSWEVGQVKSMWAMFDGATSFNQPLDRWDVRNVIMMPYMFQNATSFNRDLRYWQLRDDADASDMFTDADAFNNDETTLPPNSPGVFTKRARLKAAVDELLAEDPTGFKEHPRHGPIGTWDVSRVTDMTSLFAHASQFNQPLNSWNVSNVKDMRLMFWEAYAFDQPLDQWDVRKVVSMIGMFRDATSFNQDLRYWDAHPSVNKSGMFDGAATFNNDETKLPPNSPGIFVGRERLKTAVDDLLKDDNLTGAKEHPIHGPIGKWDVSRVTDMKYLFYLKHEFNQPLNGWDVGNVKNMDRMFAWAYSFNQPLDTWDVSNVDNMQHMFQFAKSFNQDLCSWIVKDDASIDNMFAGAVAFFRDPETRPPRRKSQVDGGRACPPLSRGTTRPRDEGDDSPPPARPRMEEAART